MFLQQHFKLKVQTRRLERLLKSNQDGLLRHPRLPVSDLVWFFFDQRKMVLQTREIALGSLTRHSSIRGMSSLQRCTKREEKECKRFFQNQWSKNRQWTSQNQWKKGIQVEFNRQRKVHDKYEITPADSNSLFDVSSRIPLFDL